jgi:hypothetical protein
MWRYMDKDSCGKGTMQNASIRIYIDLSVYVCVCLFLSLYVRVCLCQCRLPWSISAYFCSVCLCQSVYSFGCAALRRLFPSQFFNNQESFFFFSFGYAALRRLLAAWCPDNQNRGQGADEQVFLCLHLCTGLFGWIEGCVCVFASVCARV